MRMALIATGMSVTVAACNSARDESPAAALGAAERQGTIRFVDIEGGCWLIEAASERIQPLDLSREFMIDGLSVVFAVRDAPGVLTTCQAGIPMYVHSMRRSVP